MKFNERWTVVPLYSGSYQGVKGIGDGVGAGTLYQQAMEHRVSATGIYSFTGTTWRLKPSVSHKWQYLKETLDEKWGKGLFDYRKVGVGLELENAYRAPFSYRVGVDFFSIRYPNFQSLESDAKTDPNGNPLNRENASRDVLDTHNVQLSVSASRPFPYDDPRISVQAGYSILYQSYRDQRLIGPDGQNARFRPFDRADYLQTLSASVAYPRPLALFGRELRSAAIVGVSVAHNGSNQNTFDATRTRFIFDSYSYWSVGIGPSYSVSWGPVKQPTTAGLAFNYNRVQYVGRLAQDNQGVYTAANQYQDRYTASLTYLYPLASGFNVRAQGNFLWTVSNQVYEKTYAYNYRTANYLMGVTYEY